jgi:hypothetical protein
MPANRITRCVDRKVPQLDGGRIGRKCVGICRSRFRRLWARDIADRARDRGDPMRSSRQAGNRSGVGTQRQRVWSQQRRITALPRFRKINKFGLYQTITRRDFRNTATKCGCVGQGFVEHSTNTAAAHGE